MNKEHARLTIPAPADYALAEMVACALEKHACNHKHYARENDRINNEATLQEYTHRCLQCGARQHIGETFDGLRTTMPWR